MDRAVVYRIDDVRLFNDLWVYICLVEGPAGTDHGEIYRAWYHGDRLYDAGSIRIYAHPSTYSEILITYYAVVYSGYAHLLPIRHDHFPALCLAARYRICVLRRALFWYGDAVW